MSKLSIKDGVHKKPAPIDTPIAVGLTAEDAKRWERLNRELKMINRKSRLSVFVRPKILEVMDEVEAMLAADGAPKAG